MNKEMIEQVVMDSGLWDAGREASHGFILSPSIYEIDQPRREEFERIGVTLHDCLGGLGRIIYIAADPRLARNKTWQMLARVSRTGIPAIYRDIQLTNPGRVPAVCKVDFMESAENHLFIAEIDGHNKHGLGYSTLAARIRHLLMPNATTFPGVAAMITKAVKKRGNSNNELILLYADQERFYLPEFSILQDELAKLGVNLIVSTETQFSLPLQNSSCKLFLDFPFLYRSPTLNQELARLYQKGEVDFLIPPKPFLGSKAILALLRNDQKNKELEAILRSQIPSSSLEFLRGYIPESYLISKGMERAYWEEILGSKKFVIKRTISSGMKGIAFPKDPKFAAFLAEACGSFYHFILQEEITNCSRTLSYFTEKGEVLEGEWYARITAHFVLRRVADLVVTARRDKKVHGALDCLQIGTAIV